MFKLIGPTGHKTHQSDIAAFLDLLKVYQNFDLSLTRKSKATFFIAEDTKYGVYGGTVLYPQKVYDLTDSELVDRYEDAFRGAFQTFQPLTQEFWIARICFCREANTSPENLEALELCEGFYRDLYEFFLSVGNGKGLEFLSFSLCSFDTVEPPFYKEWPDCMPVRLSDATDDLSHGILSLLGKKFIPRKPRHTVNQNPSEAIPLRRVR